MYLILGIFVDIPHQTAGIIIVFATFMVNAYAIFNVTRLKVEEVSIPLDIEEGIRAVQISDVHIGPIRKEGFIKGMIDKIMDLNSEVVFITGDLFDGSSKLHDGILKISTELKCPY